MSKQASALDVHAKPNCNTRYHHIAVIGMAINFVDLKKAFDMVDWEPLWKVLPNYGIPIKLVKIIQALSYDNKYQVIHNSTLSQSFSVHTGVRQGCLLSPLIFSVVIDWIMRTSTTPPREIQWSLTAKLEDLDRWCESTIPPISANPIENSSSLRHSKINRPGD